MGSLGKILSVLTGRGKIVDDLEDGEGGKGGENMDDDGKTRKMLEEAGVNPDETPKGRAERRMKDAGMDIDNIRNGFGEKVGKVGGRGFDLGPVSVKEGAEGGERVSAVSGRPLPKVSVMGRELDGVVDANGQVVEEYHGGMEVKAYDKKLTAELRELLRSVDMKKLSMRPVSWVNFPEKGAASCEVAFNFFPGKNGVGGIMVRVKFPKFAGIRNVYTRMIRLRGEEAVSIEAWKGGAVVRNDDHEKVLNRISLGFVLRNAEKVLR